MQWFSLSNRSLKSWLNKYHSALSEEVFFNRESVLQRQRYHFFAELPEYADLLTLVEDNKKPLRLWLTGSGGNGKSSLAFYLSKELAKNSKNKVLPILLDEDWQGSLEQHIATKMQINNKKLSEQMICKMGKLGLLCPIVDSLSERQHADEKITELSNSNNLKHFKRFIFTSRKELPAGAMWEKLTSVQITEITPNQVQALIEIYAPKDKQQSVTGILKPIVFQGNSLSPLFIKLAIEQILSNNMGQLERLDKESLVVEYIEILRRKKLDIDQKDLLRAAELIAYSSLVNGIPNEFNDTYMHGILTNSATEIAPFYKTDHKTEINAKQLINMLEQAGILERKPLSRHLQFTYDPIAEVLATMYKKRIEEQTYTFQR